MAVETTDDPIPHWNVKTWRSRAGKYPESRMPEGTCPGDGSPEEE